MRLKRILCMVCIMFMIGIPAMAAQYQINVIDNTTHVLEISAAIDSSYDGQEVMVMVLNPGHSANEFTSDNTGNVFGALQYAEQKTYVAGTSLTFRFTINPKGTVSLDDTKYSVIFKINGVQKELLSFNYYADAPAKASNIAQLNALTGSSANRGEVIGKAIKMFGTSDFPLYSADLDLTAVAELFAELKGNKVFALSDTKAIETVLQEAIICRAYYESSGALLSDGMLQYTDLCGFNSTTLGYYTNNLSDTGISNVNKALFGKAFRKYSDIASSFAQNAVLYAIYNNRLGGYGHIGTIIEDNQSLLIAEGLNYSKFNSSSKKNNIISDLYANPQSSIQGVADYINAALAAASAGGTSTGGGGSSKSTLSLPQSENVVPIVPIVSIFDDLSDVQWATEAISYLKSKQIISGVADRVFDPVNTVKREEFCKMVILAFDLAMPYEDTGFTDLSDTDWSAPYISSAVRRGVVKGTSGATFGVGENIKREDIAAMLYRVMNQPVDNVKCTFSDFDEVSDYAKDAVAALQTLGIIQGNDGRFSPKEFATRAEAAKILYEIIKLGGAAE